MFQIGLISNLLFYCFMCTQIGKQVGKQIGEEIGIHRGERMRVIRRIQLFIYVERIGAMVFYTWFRRLFYVLMLVKYISSYRRLMTVNIFEITITLLDNSSLLYDFDLIGPLFHSIFLHLTESPFHNTLDISNSNSYPS